MRAIHSTLRMAWIAIRSTLCVGILCLGTGLAAQTVEEKPAPATGEDRLLGAELLELSSGDVPDEVRAYLMVDTYPAAVATVTISTP